MTSTNIAHTSSSLQPQSVFSVYEYTLTVANEEDRDTQELTAAFTSKPTPLDWQQWLAGWQSCGYVLADLPKLIHII